MADSTALRKYCSSFYDCQQNGKLALSYIVAHLCLIMFFVNIFLMLLVQLYWLLWFYFLVEHKGLMTCHIQMHVTGSGSYSLIYIFLKKTCFQRENFEQGRRRLKHHQLFLHSKFPPCKSCFSFFFLSKWVSGHCYMHLHRTFS